MLLFFDLGLILVDPAGGDDSGAPIDDDAAVFIGRVSQPLIADAASAVGDHRILAVPLVEPGQTVGLPDDIPRYIHEEVIEPLAAYYRDASGDRLRIDGDVYGFEVVAAGQGPLPLINRFDQFWNGGIEAGGFRVRIADVAQPFEIFFDGTEELVVAVDDPRRSIVDQEFTINPSAGRVKFSSVLSSAGSATLSFGPSDNIVLQTEVDGLVQTQVLNFPDGDYLLPADLGRLQDDLSAELDAAVVVSPAHRLRLVVRIHRTNLLLDFHFGAPSASRRRVYLLEVRSDHSFHRRISSFAFSPAHRLDESRDMATALGDAAFVAELDAGLSPLFSSSVAFRVELTPGTLRTRVEANAFDGSVRHVGQQRLDKLGLQAPSDVSRGFQGSVAAPDEDPPLRFDGSEWARIRAARGGTFELRIPALFGSGLIVPAPELVFDGVTGTLTIDGDTRSLTFPAATVASTKVDLEAYLQGVLASTGLAAADRMVPEVRVDPAGILSVLLYFDESPAPGRPPRRVVLTVEDSPQNPAYQLGLGSMLPFGPIQLDRLANLAGDLAVVVDELPFDPPSVSRDGYDIVVEFTFDVSQAGDNNEASVTMHNGLDRFGFGSAEPVRGNDVAPGRQFAPHSFRDSSEGLGLGTDVMTALDGTRVEVVDRRAVTIGAETFNVFHVAVVRREAEVLDLFFDRADPPWKAPDAWVDDSLDEGGRENWAVGEPRDQGDTIRVPGPMGAAILHKLVARVHNGSSFAVPRADVAFYLCKPPGSGDDGNFIRIGDASAIDIPAGGTARAELDWAVAFGDDGHQCLRVELFDWELPDVPDGHPGFTDDIVEENNRAQKNFDQFQVVPGSPYRPVRFEYSVANDGPLAELVRLQADRLSVGMVVRTRPAQQWVEPGEVVVFDCTLQLDIERIKPDCHWDREYAITAWRRTGDSWERWGGCQYLVSPRLATATSLEGTLRYGQLRVGGVVAPSPGGGRVDLQMVNNLGVTWLERIGVSAAGRFRYERGDIDGAVDWIRAVARFEGYDSRGSSVSEEITLHHTTLI